MISVEEALEKILGTIHVLEPEHKPILECLGQVLDSEIISSIDIPPHDNSAMDGFAVRAADTENADCGNAIILRIVGQVAAGYTTGTEVVAGSAVRIMTGAPVPPGADAVVQFENTDEADRQKRGETLSEIGILQPAVKGLNIRRRGEDITKGQIALEKGTVLRPAEIGVLASLGIASAGVIRRPLVSVLATGDELSDINQRLAPGRIYDSNTFTIAANILRCGGIPRIIGIGLDTVESLHLKISQGLDADMLITSGGVSRGDYDVVKDVLAQIGKIGFWTVRMKPGKPLAFGVIRRAEGCRARDIPHLGLPGNPVSSMTTFEMFARPAILKMMGKTSWVRPQIKAIIDSDIINDDGRRIFVRVKLNKRANVYHARVTGPQGSGILTSMSQAQGLAIVPEDSPGVKAGDVVDVRLIDIDGDMI